MNESYKNIQYISTKNPEFIRSTKNPEFIRSTKNPEFIRSTKNPEFIRSTGSDLNTLMLFS
jgi:hypothetical protein